VLPPLGWGVQQQQGVIVRLWLPAGLTQLMMVEWTDRYSLLAGYFLSVDYYRLTPFYTNLTIID